MSVWNDGSNAKLGEVIEHLESLPPDMPVEHGFARPHSYRGYYEDLAFEPEANTTVGAMLKAARFALGRAFTGWKGGEFTMTKDTDCWLAEMGSSGQPIVIPGEYHVYQLPVKV